jgi:ABC-type transport system involved in multi-copper enzyme maturation permease subunit
MPISERGYIHWQGRLDEGRSPWRPIARLGLKLSFKRKFFKFALGTSLLPAFIFMVGVYISERIDDFKFMMRGERRLLAVNPEFFNAYFTGDFLLFMMVMLMVLAGAGLIADDLKYNSLQLYFARPVRKRDYLFGKMGIAAFFLLLLTLVPGTLFILLKLIFSGSFKLLTEYPWLPLSVVLASFVLTGFFSLYTLFVSSLGKNRRYVSILLFLIYLFSDIFFGIFYGLFRQPAFCLMSIKCNLQQVGAAIFRVPGRYDVPWLYSALVLIAIAGAAAFVLQRKIRGVEVIR